MNTFFDLIKKYSFQNSNPQNSTIFPKDSTHQIVLPNPDPHRASYASLLRHFMPFIPKFELYLEFTQRLLKQRSNTTKTSSLFSEQCGTFSVMETDTTSVKMWYYLQLWIQINQHL